MTNDIYYNSSGNKYNWAEENDIYNKYSVDSYKDNNVKGGNGEGISDLNNPDYYIKNENLGEIDGWGQQPHIDYQSPIEDSVFTILFLSLIYVFFSIKFKKRKWFGKIKVK